jgi:hypothetical protein
MATPRWVPEFFRAESKRLRLTADILEQKSSANDRKWRGVAREMARGRRELADTLDKACDSKSDEQLQKAGNVLLNYPAKKRVL